MITYELYYIVCYIAPKGSYHMITNELCTNIPIPTLGKKLIFLDVLYFVTASHFNTLSEISYENDNMCWPRIDLGLPKVEQLIQ